MINTDIIFVNPVFMYSHKKIFTKGAFIMNKKELVAAVAAKTEMTQVSVEKALKAIIEATVAEVAKKGKVQLIGFGTFEVRKRAARKARNPQTGDEIKIKATKVPAFKAGKALKDAVK
jgi:DNA-binding protein HU-beta